MFLTRGGQSTSLTVLVHGVHDPVNTRIVSDRDVRRINKNNFEVFISGVLVDPVRVQHSQVISNATSTFLSNTAKISGEFKLINTVVLRLSVDNTLQQRALASTSANSNSVDDIALIKKQNELINKIRLEFASIFYYLLCFVAKLVSFIGSCGSSDTLNLFGLTVLPCSTNRKTLFAAIFVVT